MVSKDGPLHGLRYCGHPGRALDAIVSGMSYSPFNSLFLTFYIIPDTLHTLPHSHPPPTICYRPFGPPQHPLEPSLGSPCQRIPDIGG
jgi:hypothetical protein